MYEQGADHAFTMMMGIHIFGPTRRPTAAEMGWKSTKVMKKKRNG